MGKILTTYSRFEDLPVWISARKLTNLIYEITKNRDFKKDYGLKDQIRRASISLMSNIAEGFEHESQAQFSTYLGRAKASAGEIRCQLYIAFDQHYINEEQFQEACLLAKECSQQTYGLIKYIRTLPKSPRVK